MCAGSRNIEQPTTFIKPINSIAILNAMHLGTKLARMFAVECTDVARGPPVRNVLYCLTFFIEF